MHPCISTNTVHPSDDGHNRPPVWYGIAIRQCRYCGAPIADREPCPTCGPRRARPRSILDAPDWQLTEGVPFALRPIGGQVIA